MAQLKFIAKVSHQGKMRVIVVPKRLHSKLAELDENQVLIILEKII